MKALKAKQVTPLQSLIRSYSAVRPGPERQLRAGHEKVGLKTQHRIA